MTEKREDGPMGADHLDRGDDLAAYALDALPPAETAELERHLEGCETCRARLRTLEPAVDVLPTSVEQRTPPAALRARLMATVRAEADEAVERPVSAAGERPRRGWRGLVLRPATALAAAALLVAGVATGYALRGDSADESTTVAARAASPELAGSVAATLERQDGSATLHVEEMPEIASDEVYEVWVQRSGVMEPASTFVLSHDGTAEAAVPGPLEDAQAVVVTREPRGGSERPTGEPLLEAPLN